MFVSTIHQVSKWSWCEWQHSSSRSRVRTCLQLSSCLSSSVVVSVLTFTLVSEHQWWSLIVFFRNGDKEEVQYRSTEAEFVKMWWWSVYYTCSSPTTLSWLLVLLIDLMMSMKHQHFDILLLFQMNRRFLLLNLKNLALSTYLCRTSEWPRNFFIFLYCSNKSMEVSESDYLLVCSCFETHISSKNCTSCNEVHGISHFSR